MSGTNPADKQHDAATWQMRHLKTIWLAARLSELRSSFALGIPAAIRRFRLRIERHAKGEVFTVERTEQDGRSSSDSTILFFDRKPRDYQDLDCRGTQSSQRVDNRTLEILGACEAGAWMRVVRRVDHERRADPAVLRSTARWTSSPNAIGASETVRRRFING